MAKDKLTEYDSNAANNTVVGDVNLAENSALPSDMNNAVREVMSHQKEAFGSGTPLYVDQTNNRVGVGTASPGTTFETSGAGTIARLTGTGTNVYLGLGNSSDSGGYLAYDGTDIQIWSQSTKRITIDSDGLKFGSDTAAANALNDYEEGTVSSISDGSGGGLTYSLYHGRYRKIGDIVNYELDFQFPITSDTSQNTVTCLPFNPAVHGSGTIGYTTYNAGISVLALDTSNNIKFYNLAGSGLANNSLSNVRFLINFTYQTNA